METQLQISRPDSSLSRDCSNPIPQEMETQFTDLVNKVKAPETDTVQNLSSHNRKTYIKNKTKQPKRTQIIANTDKPNN